MNRYTSTLIGEAKALRKKGRTYREICQVLGVEIPKGTLSSWFKGMVLPNGYYERLAIEQNAHLARIRLKALKVHKRKRKQYFQLLERKNAPIAKDLDNLSTAKIALAVLCLGEASKYKNGSRFCLSNTDPRIIILFLQLLKQCYSFRLQRVRCRVQCRADQDIQALEEYWQKVTGIPKELFNKAWIDKRTIGKPTLRKGYMGVLTVDYHDEQVRHDLESLAKMLYIQVCDKGP